MAYPLETGTTRTATATVINLPLQLGLTSPTRTWGASTFAVYSRTTAGATIWRMPLPPQTGQMWPRSRPA